MGCLMPDYLPRFRPAGAVTFTASADVTGGRLVALTGARLVGPAGADSALIMGVAATDAVAGEQVGVYMRKSGVQQLTASAAIATGAKVSSAAAGKVATAGTNPIGIALKAAAADGSVIDVLFT